MSDQKNKENTFKIVFDGQINQVDAQTFINSLVNISNIVQEINNEIESNKKINIKIKALDPGSFITTLELQEVVNSAQKLFTCENLQWGANIIVVLGGLYKLKKHLLNKKPKKVTVIENENKVEIENEKGKIEIFGDVTYNIYNKNQIINDSISNNFANLDDDPSITAFEITHNDKAIFFAKREEFNQLATKSEVLDRDKKAKIVSATIVIHKIVFEDRYKWEFYYSGNKISANIADEEFYQKINQGEKFAKGDSLKVDLQINQIFDPAVNIFVNHSYQVNKVHEHIPRNYGTQLKIE